MQRFQRDDLILRPGEAVLGKPASSRAAGHTRYWKTTPREDETLVLTPAGCFFTLKVVVFSQMQSESVGCIWVLPEAALYGGVVAVRLSMNDVQMAIANKILNATVNNVGARDEQTVAALWAEFRASGVAPHEVKMLQKALSCELYREPVYDPLRYDGAGNLIDWNYLVREASPKEIDRYLLSFDSYQRTLAMFWVMTASSPRRRLQIFLDFGCVCDAPWPYRSNLAGLLRSALGKISLTEVLGPAELSFYTGLPNPVPIWRGCERGRERGLSWTIDQTVAEGFARGKRWINKHPTLASAEIPKKHIFAVFLDRQESELAIDPRRLRKLCAESLPETNR